MKHTPEPWKIIDHDEDHITITDEEQMYGICRIEESASESRLSMKANAHLIAAAPELLKSVSDAMASLEVVADHFEAVGEQQNMIDDLREYIEKCRLVIAKARGES